MNTYFFPFAPLDGRLDIFSWSDILFAPLYIYFIYKICLSIYNKKYKNTSLGSYFLNGVKIKIGVSVLYWAVNRFYYGGGDTYVYYWHILIIKQLLFTDPTLAYNILFDNTEFHTKLYIVQYFLGNGSYIYTDNTFIVIFCGFFLSFLCMFSYLNISLIMSLFAFLGSWRLFKMFREMYPNLEREMAIATLYIPSVVYWGCGIMKDPLCMGFLGVLSFSTYELIFKKKNKVLNLIYIILCTIGLVKVKVYIILAYAPALVVWVFTRYRANIKSPIVRALVTPIFIVVAGAGGALMLTLMGSYAERYALDEMMRTAQDTQNWLVTSSKTNGGSFYTLGNIEYSMFGLIKIFPKAINVALFRPYIWEARKIMLFPAAIEGIFTMFITVRLLFRTGFFRFIKMVGANAEVQFCLIFSIIFAFAVGFTSFNFGALARYKIPFMPFYYIAIFILSDTQKKDEILVKKNKK
jgi:hypothetical protein